MFILETDLDCGNILPILDIALFALRVIQYVAPVLLIIWGTIDLVKSVVAAKEDDIKKSQKTLVKRIISAVILFLIPIAVSVLLGLIGSDDWKECWDLAQAQIISSEEDYEKRKAEYDKLKEN